MILSFSISRTSVALCRTSLDEHVTPKYYCFLRSGLFVLEESLDSKCMHCGRLLKLYDQPHVFTLKRSVSRSILQHVYFAPGISFLTFSPFHSALMASSIHLHSVNPTCSRTYSSSVLAPGAPS